MHQMPYDHGAMELGMLAAVRPTPAPTDASSSWMAHKGPATLAQTWNGCDMGHNRPCLVMGDKYDRVDLARNAQKTMDEGGHGWMQPQVDGMKGCSYLDPSNRQHSFFKQPPGGGVWQPAQHVMQVGMGEPSPSPGMSSVMMHGQALHHRVQASGQDPKALEVTWIDDKSSSSETGDGSGSDRALSSSATSTYWTDVSIEKRVKNGEQPEDDRQRHFMNQLLEENRILKEMIRSANK